MLYNLTFEWLKNLNAWKFKRIKSERLINDILGDFYDRNCCNCAIYIKISNSIIKWKSEVFSLSVMRYNKNLKGSYKKTLKGIRGTQKSWIISDHFRILTFCFTNQWLKRYFLIYFSEKMNQNKVNSFVIPVFLKK